MPAFADILSHNHQSAQLNILFHHHQLARSEAIKHKSRVLLCKSNNGQQCTPSAKWSDGWLIFLIRMAIISAMLMKKFLCSASPLKELITAIQRLWLL
ncbi:GspH/FimT family pseudopilin [sulfur-oxidizing endosymbiont of Gigantopelta aegis]|uniref:GspH/FimT family pseudopilin n=1 Tax=sulfur-oxidizing endosymbiont of Gigantopelta aegis TaxID=2794934 RepID=UPI003CCE3692